MFGNTKHLSALLLLLLYRYYCYYYDISLYIVFLYHWFVFVDGETMLDLKNLKPKLQ